MKKIAVAIVFFSAISGCEAQLNIGPVVGKNYMVRKPALGLTAEYKFNKKLSIAGDYLHYVNREKTFGSVTLKQNDLNVNLHYILRSQPKIDFYGISGLNFHGHARIAPSEEATSFTSSINLGAGCNWKVASKIFLFTETHYGIGLAESFSYSNLTFKLGGRVWLRKSKTQ